MATSTGNTNENNIDWTDKTREILSLVYKIVWLTCFIIVSTSFVIFIIAVLLNPTLFALVGPFLVFFNGVMAVLFG